MAGFVKMKEEPLTAVTVVSRLPSSTRRRETFLMRTGPADREPSFGLKLSDTSVRIRMTFMRSFYLTKRLRRSTRHQNPMRTYLEKAAGKHTWIDGLMLQAAVAKKLGAILVIWYKQGGTWRRVTLAPAWTRQGCPKTAKGVEPVVLILENQHYSWFQKPPGKKVPAGWIRAS